MNHTNNQIQNLQNTTSSTRNVIDLTKENPSIAANAYCPITFSKKQRRLETTNEYADTRPQKRSRIEQAQEHKLPSIPNILNPIPQEINPLLPALYNDNTIIPTDFTSAQTSNGMQTYALPHSAMLSAPPSQYVPQNFSLTNYNVARVMNMSPIQQPITPISSSSTTSSNNISQEIIDLTTDSDDDNDNDCIVDEKETNRDLCWGMINTEFLILYPRPCTGGKGEEEVQLKREWGKSQGKI
jgi:hypothetical protein